MVGNQSVEQMLSAILAVAFNELARLWRLRGSAPIFWQPKFDSMKSKILPYPTRLRQLAAVAAVALAMIGEVSIRAPNALAIKRQPLSL